MAALRQVGIQPDAIVLRADREIPEGVKRKISLMCDVDTEAVASCVDAPSIYDIPKVLHSEGLDAYVIRRLGLPFRDVDWTDWDELLRRVHNPEHDVEIALVGKYIDLPDAYLSVTEAMRAGGFHHDARVRIRWVASDECETEAGAQKALGGVDAVLVPGGFGVRGIEGKLGALTWSRERGVPTLGICLGLQCMVIEYARNVAGIADASSSEFDPGTTHPVIATMEEQKAYVEGAGDLGGTMRLGTYPAHSGRGLGAGPDLRHLEGGRAPPAPLRGQQRLPRPARGGRAAVRRHLAGRHAGRVRRAARRRPPVLRVDPGPPGVPVPPEPGAPALRRAGRRRHRRASARHGWSRSTASVAETRGRPVTLGAPTARAAELVDRLERRPVEHSERVFDGMVWDVVRDTVDLGEGGTVRREYVAAPRRRVRRRAGRPRTGSC